MINKTRIYELVTVTMLIFGCYAISSVLGFDQPQWGQKNSRNMVSDEIGLPETFDPQTGENIKWTVSLGSQNYSTPTIANGKVFIGANNDDPRDPRHRGDRGVLLCLNEEDGSLYWQLVVPRIEEDDDWLDWPRVGLPSPPTIEDGRVYTLTNRFELVCLDLDGHYNGDDGPYFEEGSHMAPKGEQAMQVTQTDADIIWLFDLPSEAGIYQHDAAHASILIDGPYLYLNSCNGV
ncbi:PQQ-binding-like beta-propeller repeat protein, partial [Planctomycetota bacterium]